MFFTYFRLYLPLLVSKSIATHSSLVTQTFHIVLKPHVSWKPKQMQGTGRYYPLDTHLNNKPRLCFRRKREHTENNSVTK